MNKLSRDNAQQFCKNYCQSNLASIHKQNDYQNIINILDQQYLLNNNNNNNNNFTNSIWFGLSDNGQYIDNSSFDFGTDKSQYPWSLNYNNNTNLSSQCIEISNVYNNYEWINSENCNNKQEFICNECQWTQLTKYILIELESNQEKTWNEAQNYCKQNYLTSLADINSEMDYHEATLLCKLSDHNSCWIGAHYHYNINNNSTCIQLNSLNNNYTLNYSMCNNNKKSTFLCNLPNQFCYPSKWNIINESYSNWILNECQLINDNNNNNKNDEINLILSENNTTIWKKVTIEHVFSVSNPLNSDAMTGIVINIKDFNNNDFPLYIALKYNESKIVLIFNDTIIADGDVDDIELDTFYTLNIIFNRFGTFHISLNDKFGIAVYNIYNDLEIFPLNYWIHSISIKNEYISTHSKSLFLNGDSLPYLTTLSPTNHPTQEPTTQKPSVSPITFAPTPMPINYTTPNPTTDNPTTDNPTTKNPTTTNPTTNNPTTNNPTTNKPTTFEPSIRDTATTQYIIKTNYKIEAMADWSPSFLSISVTMRGSDGIVINGININSDSMCNDIFNNYTMNIIGNNDAECTINYNDNYYDIDINLPSTATINLTNSQLVIKENVFNFRFENESDIFLYDELIIIQSVNLPSFESDIISPNIITSVVSEISSCDDLILDARSSTNLGGRDNGIFEWKIKNINYTEYGDIVTIPNEIILSLSSNDIYIILTVTNWYGASSTESIYVQKSNLRVVPKIKLHGIHGYSSKNAQILNGKIDIYASITVKNNCDDDEDEIILNENDYNIKWSVKMTISNQTIYDEDKLQLLNEYLLSQTDESSLSLDASKHLQAGIEYEFIMNFKCNGNGFVCRQQNITHIVRYKYSDIYCDIMGQNQINIDMIKLTDLISYDLILNGLRLTYDPDDITSDNTHLQFEWQCFDNYLNKSCDFMLQRTKTANIWANFEHLALTNESNSSLNNLNNGISYTFKMTVTDSYNPLRESCVDSVTFTVNNIINNDEINNQYPDLLIISLITLNDKIKIEDRLRIIAEITNMDKSEYKHLDVTFEWREINGYLTNEEIIQYQRLNPCSCPNNFNLILKPNVLKRGKLYSFQLEIIMRDPNNSTILASGNSSIAQIYVQKPPKVIQDSLQISPPCLNGQIVFDSTEQYLENLNKFSLSVNADGDENNLPLLYRFGFKLNGGDKWYNLHSNLLAESFLENAVLPLGDVRIISRVFDSTGTFVADDIECKIWINQSNVECPDLTQFENDISNLLTIYEKYQFIFQESLIYLQYLYRNGIDIECIDNVLWQILNILNVEIDNLCFENNNFVIQLGQVMDLWINLAIENNIDLVENDDIKMVRNLIFLTFDPCQFIMYEINCNVELLYISTDSVISNNVKIFYSKNDKDITSNLSIIITNNEYHDIMYSLIDQVIIMNDNLYNTGIYKLISSVLYIASLSSISTSIPGEESNITSFNEFSIYSIRVSNQIIKISLQNQNIIIPEDVLYSDDNHDILQATDTLIIATNSNNSRYINSSLLSKESLSITISNGNINTNKLPSNINMTFNCDSKNQEICQNYQCCWYDLDYDIWNESGCNTTYNPYDNHITCSCSHLTTFSTINHNMTSQQIIITNNQTLSYQRSFKYIYIIFAALFMSISMYILLEIYPFFIDKNLNFKQSSIGIMILLWIISILYLIACIFLFYIEMNIIYIMIECILLFIQLIFFFIFSLIFNFSWYNALNLLFKNKSDSNNQIKKFRKCLFIFNIIFIIIIFMIYFIIIRKESNQFTKLIKSIWCLILFITCLMFIIYGYRVGNAMILTAKMISSSSELPSSSNFESKDVSTSKRLLLINLLITLYFAIQLIASFIVIYNIINIFTTFFFILLLCFMHKNPMKRLLLNKSDIDKTSNYHCCCHKLFILGQIKGINGDKDNNNDNGKDSPSDIGTATTTTVTSTPGMVQLTTYQD